MAGVLFYSQEGMMNVNCKYCGAPLRKEAETCEYCGGATDYGEKILREREIMRQETERLREKSGLPGMRYASLCIVVFAYAVTFGYYSPYWYISRTKSINTLHTKSKLNIAVPVLYALCCAEFFLLPSTHESLGLTYEAAYRIWTAIFFLLPVFSALMALHVKKILRGHSANYGLVKGTAPSQAMAIIFGPAYLQYQVNKMIESGVISRNI